MGLARNLTAGLSASAWSALVSIAVVPLYLRYLGIEAYGLIGFFGALQALFSMLDLGMTPTMSREVARSTTSEDNVESRRLLHSLAIIYWLMAGLIAVAAVLGGGYLAAYWLRESILSQETVGHAVMLMGIIIACRWPNGVYSGALIGAQRLALASGIGAATTTASAIGAVLILALVSPTIEAFFLWQAGVGLSQALITRWFAWRALGGWDGSHFSMSSLRRVWRFSAGLGVSGILGLLLLQSDKVILSRLVSLRELGLYTLAGLASRILYTVLTPVFSVVYPRMTALVASGDEVGLATLYRDGTRLLMTALCPMTVFVALFAGDAAKFWAPDDRPIGSIPLTMALLTIGTALNGAMHFPYALQLANGNARLPLITTVSLLVVFAPMLTAFTFAYGIAGAGAAWLILNLLYVMLGSWLTHRYYLTTIGRRWLVEDVLFPASLSVAVIGTGRAVLVAANLSELARLLAGAALPLMAVAAIVALSPSLMNVLRLRLAGHAPA